MIDTKTMFIDWVRKQDQKAAYDFFNAFNCPFATFEKEMGMYHGPRQGPSAAEPGDLVLPGWAAEALVHEPRTYGSLLDRLEDRKPSLMARLRRWFDR